MDIITDNVTLLYGDCLERMKEIKSGSVDMVLTDPPYGTTACKWDSIIPLGPMWEQLKRIIKVNGSVVLTAANPFSSVVVCSNLKNYKYNWVWRKNRPTNYPNAKRRPLTKHEDICVFQMGNQHYFPQKTTGHKPTKAAKGCSQGRVYNGTNVRDYSGGETTRFPTTVLEFDCERGFHPTQKPVQLMEYLIKTYTKEGETVLDFTMGSGTTGVACVNTGRKFIGIELDPTYYGIACNRILTTTT